MKLLAELIKISSRSGSESTIQRFISNWLIEHSLTPFSYKGNTIVRIKGTAPDKAIIFNAHVDTVGSGNNNLWKKDPLSPHYDGDTVVGLGASDEKSGVVLGMMLAAEYGLHTPPCDVLFFFVNQEETTGQGSKDCLQWFMKTYKKRYRYVAGILPEPTGLKTIEVGHKGNAFIRLIVTGESGHGSEPHKVKTNAVLIIAEILLKLPQLEKMWEKYRHPVLGVPTIAAGTFLQSGDIESPNKIADTCVAVVDIRTTPSMHSRALDEVQAFLSKYPVKVDYLYQPLPTGLTEVNEAIVLAAKKSIPSATITTSKGSTDLCFFSNTTIPAIILGPGEKECIHSPNEYCYPRKIKEGITILKKIIAEWELTIEKSM